MSNHKKPVALAIAAAIATVAIVVMACGPEFPLQLLDDRAGTLKSTPSNTFAYEAAHLVKPADSLKAYEATPAALTSAVPDHSSDLPGNGTLNAAQLATVSAMRDLGDGDAAYARGEGLPESVRLYFAGVVDEVHAEAPLPDCDAKAAGAASGAKVAGAVNAASAANAASSTDAASEASVASASVATGVANVASTASSTSTASTPNSTTTPATATRAADTSSNASATHATNAATTTANAASPLAKPTATTKAACRADRKHAQAIAAVDKQNAQRRFQAALDVPAATAGPGAVWVAYALGEMHKRASSEAGYDFADETRAAQRAFAVARERARAGAADPSGLAVFSYGEEALLFLRSSSKGQCDDTDLTGRTACVDAIDPADMNRAVGLYAEQAARGSAIGFQSLVLIASWALSSPARATRLIGNPLTQRLLVAYGLARVGDVVNDDPSSTTDYYAMLDVTGHLGYADVARGTPHVKPNPVLETLVDAIRQQGIAQPAGADRLAALAYRTGRYDLARTLIAHDNSALSSWVRAKLALRDGDVASAARAYAEASKAFPVIDGSLDAGSVALVKGEQGVLALSRGQYLVALDQLYAATQRARAGVVTDDPYAGTDGGSVGYQQDMAYIAERVLTTDELKTWVDAHAPATATVPLPAGFAAFTPEQFYAWRAQHTRTLADSLRLLLARRLVRDGRVDDALPYFPADDDARFVDVDYTGSGNGYKVTAWKVRDWAAAYGAALHDAQHAWSRNARARGWFDAATLAREHGMEIMGYEQDPDFATFDGMFPHGVGRRGPMVAAYLTSASAPQPPRDTPAQRAAADLPGPFVTDGERHRYASSEAKPNERFHYRAIAADEAGSAADLLPPRSQAFAAVLCHGANFASDDADRAAALYQRYVKQGAAVPFAAHFGRDCPAPDFSAAARFPYVHAWRITRYWVHRHLYVPVAVLFIGLAGIGGWFYRRRRVG
ncbi:hypothetical protein [Paraburkholderia flava]|uniref:hypothetical protein n=1 Tax=Paraburkholderia flava TaxID=2547393 RepID=UPI00105B37E3|nr:hypothetical protein [Paraburkholderia flava]